MEAVGLTTGGGFSAVSCRRNNLDAHISPSTTHVKINENGEFVSKITGRESRNNIVTKATTKEMLARPGYLSMIIDHKGTYILQQRLCV